MIVRLYIISKVFLFLENISYYLKSRPKGLDCLINKYPNTHRKRTLNICKMYLCVTMGVYLHKVLLPCIHPKLTSTVNEFPARRKAIISGDNPTD